MGKQPSMESLLTMTLDQVAEFGGTKARRKKNKLDMNDPEDRHRINQRLKQIHKGKESKGYSIYCTKVPKKSRPQKLHDTYPMTPDPRENISNKRRKGKYQQWRRALHMWDESNSDGDDSESCSAPDSAVEAVVAQADHNDDSFDEDDEQFLNDL